VIKFTQFLGHSRRDREVNKSLKKELEKVKKKEKGREMEVSL